MLKLFKAKLKTGNKTKAQLISEYEGETPTEEELQAYLKGYHLINGLEVVVTPSIFSPSEYHLGLWDDKDDEKIREFIYAIEQDPMFGTYIDSYEEFINDWKNGNYNPAGSIVFQEGDVEIIEEIKRKEK